MEKITKITSDGDGKTAFPELCVAQTHQANSVDWKITDAQGNEIGNVALDYFDGKLRLFVWQPGDEEPSHKVHLKTFQETEGAAGK